MLNYVISLDDELQRRRHIQQQFSQKNVPYHFFDAIRPQEAKKYATEMHLAYDPRYLTNTELACMMSHIKLWEKIVLDDIPYMAIFEDDIHLGEQAEYYLTQHDWIKPEWNIIKIEAFAQKVFLGECIEQLPVGDHKIFPLLGENYGCAGYILSNQGAKQLLNYIAQFKPLIPLDHILFEYLVHQKKNSVYQMNPSICIQDSILTGTHEHLPSALEEERFYHMKCNKKRGWEKIALEIKRLINQIKLILFAKKSVFK